MLEVEGWAELMPELNALSKAGRFAEMRALVTPEMVATLAVVGTPQQCADQLRDRFAPHAREVCCYFPGYTAAPADIAELVDALR